MTRSCLSIILAAGEGTRMKSATPKVLHKIAGLSLVGHVIKAVQAVGAGSIAVVVGRDAENVQKTVQAIVPGVDVFEQKERLGTGHAVLAARAAIEKGVDDILIAFGDTPLIEASALKRARDVLAGGADLVVMGFRTEKPTGYGRLIEKGGRLRAIVEEKDATDAQKKITFCNGGLMAVRGQHLLSLLDSVTNHNAKGEYYLTDIVALADERSLNVQALDVPFDNVIGINNRIELSEAETIWQNRCRHEMMLSGVTLIQPQTVTFSYDTEIEPDVVIEPNVFFGLKTKVKSGAIIHAFSYIEGAVVEEGAEIGPFARLRPGVHIERRAKVGNFCEVKNAHIGVGAKVNHLTYIGDADIGADTNIGAGTITCNYDGINKWKTIIGENAFIGSNTALVAPVQVGNGAYVASGSIITDDVPDDALALGRARQVNKDGYALKIRERIKAQKEQKEQLKNK